MVVVAAIIITDLVYTIHVVTHNLKKSFQHFMRKVFGSTEKLKELYSEYTYTYNLESIIIIYCIYFII